MSALVLRIAETQCLQRGFLNNRTWTAARIETFRYRETVVVLRHSHRLTLARGSHFHVVAPVPDAPVLQEEKRRGIGADHSIRSQSRPSFEPFGASVGESRGNRAPVTKRHGDHLLMLSGLDENRQFDGGSGNLKPDDVPILESHALRGCRSEAGIVCLLYTSDAADDLL